MKSCIVHNDEKVSVCDIIDKDLGMQKKEKKSNLFL